jgi:hypothetical protein
MIRTVLAAALLTSSTLAHAQVVDPVAPDWARVDDRMHTTFKVGTTAMWAGLVGGIVGSISGQPLIEIAGTAATTGGTVARTAASLRQRRSIQERGVEVSGVWGYSSWGLMGTAMGLNVANQIYASGLEADEDGNPPPESMGPLIGLSLGGLAASIGSLVAASKQMNDNSRRRMELGRSSVDDSSPAFTLNWTPTYDEDGRLGLGLNGQF